MWFVRWPNVEVSAKYGQSNWTILTDCHDQRLLAECLLDGVDRDFLALFDQSVGPLYPICVPQVFVWLKSPDTASFGRMVSILVPELVSLTLCSGPVEDPSDGRNAVAVEPQLRQSTAGPAGIVVLTTPSRSADFAETNTCGAPLAAVA